MMRQVIGWTIRLSPSNLERQLDSQDHERILIGCRSVPSAWLEKPDLNDLRHEVTMWCGDRSNPAASQGECLAAYFLNFLIPVKKSSLKPLKHTQRVSCLLDEVWGLLDNERKQTHSVPVSQQFVMNCGVFFQLVGQLEYEQQFWMMPLNIPF